MNIVFGARELATLKQNHIFPTELFEKFRSKKCWEGRFVTCPIRNQLGEDEVKLSHRGYIDLFDGSLLLLSHDVEGREEACELNQAYHAWHEIVFASALRIVEHFHHKVVGFP